MLLNLVTRMDIAKRHLRLLSVVPFFISVLLIAGCASVANNAGETTGLSTATTNAPSADIPKGSGAPVANDMGWFCPSNSTPHVYSIGNESILTFEKDRELRIPIEGICLNASNVLVAAEITGTLPPRSDDFGWEEESGRKIGADLKTLFLKQKYVKDLKTGNQLTVHLVVSKFGIDAHSARTNVATATAFAARTFTLYERSDYERLVQLRRVDIHNIKAFPLPEQEARFLFGGLISQLYFVVKLTILNNESTDKLIASGLITASGRAIVNANEKGKMVEPLFTVPVEVTPQSLQHVYRILDGHEPHTGRSWTFRTLEFVGVLASATATAFGFPTDALKGINLYTGVGLPAAQKLWPDSWPGYKLNVVTMGMPELLKLPKNSEAGHKYLFFPKEEIQTLISDQTLFLYGKYSGAITPNLAAPFREYNPSRRRREILPPSVKVISLGFDSLSIPFENVLSPAEGDVYFRLSNIQKDLGAQSREVERLGAAETNAENYAVYSALTRSAVSNVLGHVTNLLASAGFTNTTNSVFRQVVTNVSHLVASFQTNGWLEDIVKDPVHGLSALKRQEDRLKLALESITKGTDPAAHVPTLDAVEKIVLESKTALAFYQQAAQLLEDLNKDKTLEKLIDKGQPDKERDAESLIRRVKALEDSSDLARKVLQ